MAKMAETGVGSWAALVLLLVSSSVVLGLEWQKVRIRFLPHSVIFFSFAIDRRWKERVPSSAGERPFDRTSIFGILDTHLSTESRGRYPGAQNRVRDTRIVIFRNVNSKFESDALKAIFAVACGCVHVVHYSRAPRAVPIRAGVVSQQFCVLRKI